MRAIASAALLQDGKSDITSDACVKRSQRCKARIIAKEPGVFCGLIEAKEVFRGMSVCEKRKDGEKVSPGDVVLEITGSAREILRRERTALKFHNAPKRVATATNKLARKIPGEKSRRCGKRIRYFRKRKNGSAGGRRPHASAFARRWVPYKEQSISPR